MARELMIHRVVEGPFENDEEEEGCWLLCLAEDRGELCDLEVYFDSFSEAYAFKHHFTKSIEPIVLTTEVEEEEEHDA
jgi:hypothetical protein